MCRTSSYVDAAALAHVCVDAEASADATERLRHLGVFSSAKFFNRLFLDKIFFVRTYS